MASNAEIGPNGIFEMTSTSRIILFDEKSQQN